jgi:hypothetical protein
MNRVGNREWGKKSEALRLAIFPLPIPRSPLPTASRQPEITTEPSARIEPHARGREAGRLGQGRERFEVVLVGIFGVYRLAGFKLDLQRGLSFGAADIDYLFNEADQMDFYAALPFVEEGAVFELSEVEVGVQIAVDAQQQIPAEGRRQVERVVVGRNRPSPGRSALRICLNNSRASSGM